MKSSETRPEPESLWIFTITRFEGKTYSPPIQIVYRYKGNSYYDTDNGHIHAMHKVCSSHDWTDFENSINIASKYLKTGIYDGLGIAWILREATLIDLYNIQAMSIESNS